MHKVKVRSFISVFIAVLMIMSLILSPFSTFAENSDDEKVVDLFEYQNDLSDYSEETVSECLKAMERLTLSVINGHYGDDDSISGNDLSLYVNSVEDDEYNDIGYESISDVHSSYIYSFDLWKDNNRVTFSGEEVKVIYYFSEEASNNISSYLGSVLSATENPQDEIKNYIGVFAKYADTWDEIQDTEIDYENGVINSVEFVVVPEQSTYFGIVIKDVDSDAASDDIYTSPVNDTSGGSDNTISDYSSNNNDYPSADSNLSEGNVSNNTKTSDEKESNDNNSSDGNESNDNNSSDEKESNDTNSSDGSVSNGTNTSDKNVSDDKTSNNTVSDKSVADNQSDNTSNSKTDDDKADTTSGNIENKDSISDNASNNDLYNNNNNNSGTLSLLGNDSGSLTAGSDSAGTPIQTFGALDLVIVDGADANVEIPGYSSTDEMGGFYYYNPDTQKMVRDTGSETTTGYVWTPDSSDENHSVVYKLHIVTQGYDAVQPKNVEIRIPMNIFRDENGVFADRIELSTVTEEEYEDRKANATNLNGINFIYTIDEEKNEIVFTNVRELKSGADYNLFIAYHTTKKTYEYLDMSKTDPCYARGTLYTTDSAGNATEDRKASPEIPVYINTSAEIQSVTKVLNQSNVYYKWQSSWGQNPNPNDNEKDYVYMVWEIESKISSSSDNPTKITQKYDFTLSEEAFSGITNAKSIDNTPVSFTRPIPNGEILKYKMAGRNTWQVWEDSSDEDRTIKNLTEKNGTTRKDYILTRLPKAYLKATDEISAYDIENKATNTVTPASGVDSKTSDYDDEKYTYAPPEYKMPQSSFSISKVGVYTPNENTVNNEKQISSYELENITKEDADARTAITGLRYHVTVNAEDFPSTFDTNNHPITAREADAKYYQKTPVEYILTDKKLELYNLETRTTTKNLSSDDYEMTGLDIQSVIKAGYFDDDYKSYSNVTLNDYVNMLDSGEITLTDGSDAAAEESAKSAEKSALERNADGSAIVELRLFINGSETPVTVAKYNAYTGKWFDVDEAYVKQSGSRFSGFSNISFVVPNVTGYQLYSKNKYYGTYLKAYPTVTLKPSAKVLEAVGESDKLQMNNFADLIVNGKKYDPATNTYENNYQYGPIERSGKVYVAEAQRESTLTKKFIPTDYNDIMNGEYLANWEVELYENMQISPTESVPTVQSGGTFYDLLPIMSTARLDEIKIYPWLEGKSDYEKDPLIEGGDYTLDYSYETDQSGFRRVMLKADITKPATRYKMIVRTVHTHSDILDYGRDIRNSVCYKTANVDLGDGTKDDGTKKDGSKIKDADVFADMEEITDKDKKKFMFSEATHHIPALISTMSQLSKTVSSETTPSARLSAIVSPGEEYTYNYRNMNSGLSYSKNLVIMDSIENYMRDDEGKSWNGSQAFDNTRDWEGIPLHFNLQLLERKGRVPAIYVTKKQVNLGKYNTNNVVYDPEKADPDRETIQEDGVTRYVQKVKESGFVEENGQMVLKSTFVNDILENYPEDGWFKITQRYDAAQNDYKFYLENGDEYTEFSKIKGFIFDFGDDVISPDETIQFGLTMRAPMAVPVSAEDGGKALKTYNNVYRYQDISDDKEFKPENSERVSHSFTHQDKTDVTYRVVGDVRLRKIDAEDNTKVIKGAVFRLSGTSDYGTIVDKTMSTNSNGIITFRNLEKGTYSLTEINATKDYQLAETREVKVDEYGIATISSPDELYSFDLTIVKKDDNGDPQKDYRYSLSSDSSDFTSQETATINTGTALFEGIKAGTYHLYGHDGEEYIIRLQNDTDEHGNVIDRNIIVEPVSGSGDTDTSGSSSNGESHYSDETNHAEIMVVRKEYGIEDVPRYHTDIEFLKVLVSYDENGNKVTTPLSGAEFTLTTVGNESSDHPDMSGYNNVITETVESSENGVLFEDIEIGKYLLKETGIPEGVAPDNTTYYVWVQNNSLTKKTTASVYLDKNRTRELTKENYEYVIENKKASEFSINKRDNVNITEPLFGAHFELYPYGTVNSDGEITEFSNDNPCPINEDALDKVYWRYTSEWSAAAYHVSSEHKTQWRMTDTSGQATFGNLMPGVAYKLIETKAPANHKDLGTSDETWESWTVFVLPNGEVKIKDSSNNEVSPDDNSSEGTSANASDLSYTLLNDRVYKQQFPVTKKWIGASTNWDNNEFPVFHMSTEEEKVNTKEATIKKNLFQTKFKAGSTFTRVDRQVEKFADYLEAWKWIAEKEGIVVADDPDSLAASASDNGFVRIDARYNGLTDGDLSQGAEYKDINDETQHVDYNKEDGVIYMTTVNGHTYFWSDAGKIYLPTSCKQWLNNSNMTGDVDFTGFAADRVTTMDGMFQDSKNITSIEMPDIGNSHNVISMENMFRGMISLETISLPLEWDMVNNKSLGYMFEGDEKVKSSIDFSKVKTSATLKNMYHIFYQFGKNNGGVEQTIVFGDDFVTSGVLNTSNFRIIGEAANVTKISFGKQCTFENVTDFSHVFSYASSLKEIEGLHYFNTKNAKTFQQAFCGCKELKSLDLSSFTTGGGKNSITLRNMFDGCNSLEVIYANPYEWPNNESQPNNSFFKNCNNLLLRINAPGSHMNKDGVKYAVVNGSQYDSSKGKEGIDYALDSNGNYIGYFTSWTASPHYEYVESVYRNSHPNYDSASVETDSMYAAAYKLSCHVEDEATGKYIPGDDIQYAEASLSKTINSFQPLSATSDNDDKAVKVDYVTTKNVIPASEYSLYGITETPSDDVKYVIEKLYIDDVEDTSHKLAARWEKYSDSEWVCSMTVYDPMAECYVWEDKISGYTTDHGSGAKLHVEKDTGNATIKNTKDGETPPELGSLVLAKEIFDGESRLADGLRTEDEFEFTIKLEKGKSATELPNKVNYGGVTFTRQETAEGTAYLQATVNLKRVTTETINEKSVIKNRIILSDIPVGYTYSISEASTTDDGYTDGGAITADGIMTPNGNGIDQFGVDGSTGTIALDTKDSATGDITAYGRSVTWKNTIDMATLSIEKQLTRKVKTGNTIEDADITSTDKLLRYEFKVSLGGLIPGKDYYYSDMDHPTDNKGSFIADDAGSAVVTIYLKHGETADVYDLPVKSTYSVKETVPEEKGAEYTAEYNVYENGGLVDEKTGESFETAVEDLDKTSEKVTFNNTKTTEKTIDIDVQKVWIGDTENDRKDIDVYVQRVSGTRIETPDDGQGGKRTLTAESGWKASYTDMPLISAQGEEYKYSISEPQVNGYKLGEVHSVVDIGSEKLVYGTYDQLYSSSDDGFTTPLAIFVYKNNLTFYIESVSDENKQENVYGQICKYGGDIYLYYDSYIYKLTDDGTNKVATKVTDFNLHRSTQPKLITYTDPQDTNVLPEQYAESVYPNNDLIFYIGGYQEGADNGISAINCMVFRNSSGEIKYIQYKDASGKNMVYAISKNADGVHYDAARAFILDDSNGTISDPDGNLSFTVTNVKYKTYKLVVSKTVDGNFGNKMKSFEFDITVGSINGIYPIRIIDGNDTEIGEIEFVNGMASFKLKHGQTAEISGLTENLEVAVREKDYQDYTVSSYSSESTLKEYKDGNIQRILLDKDEAVYFKNTRAGLVPTGIFMGYGMLLLAGAGILGYIYLNIRRQRKLRSS